MDNTLYRDFSRDFESRFDYRLDRKRVEFVMNAVRMSPRMFGEFIGKPELFREVFSGRMPITETLVARIHGRFPQIDPQWLLTGPKR